MVASRSHQHRQSTEPTLDARLVGSTISLDYSNLSMVSLRFYLMDLELLFSTNPFMLQKTSGNSMYIQPNKVLSVDLPSNTKSHVVPIPPDLATDNLMIEIIGGSIRKTLSYYSNSIRVDIDKLGQVQVLHRTTGKPIPRSYVKVYAQQPSGKHYFWLDTYTDLRGRADYCSISDAPVDIETIHKFSILIISPENGSVLKEASPPRI